MKTIILFLLLYGSTGLAGDIRYRVVPLLPDSVLTAIGGSAADINRHGDTTGSFADTGGVFHVFIHTMQGGFTDLGPGPRRVLFASGINDAGQIAAYGPADDTGHSHVFRFTPGMGLVDLGTAGGLAAESGRINNRGQVVGTAERDDGFQFAFRYTDGIGAQDLGAFSGEDNNGYSINDLGWVTGRSAGRAFIYKDDVGLIDIGPGTAGDINEAGVVVGQTDGDEIVLYRDGQVIPLGAAGGGSINNSNVVVGGAYFAFPDGQSYYHGFVWSEDTGVVDLNDLIDPSSGWFIASASAINDLGQIVGVGSGPEHIGVPAPFRLDPVYPLVITNQSASLIVFAGQEASFAVGVTGTTPTFQWRFNDSPITGATNRTLSFPIRSGTQAGGYTVVVSNLANVVTSAVATLTIYGYQFTANFKGDNERPPNRSAHAGTGTFTLTSNVLSYALGLDLAFRPTTAKLFGAANATGRPRHLIADLGRPVPFFPGPADPAAEFFVNYAGQVILNEGQLRELLAGRLFVNFTSARFPQGELRGAVLPAAPVQFTATLAGANEVSRNASAHRGSAQLTLTGNHLAYTLALDTNFNATTVGLFGPAGLGSNARRLISTLDASPGVLSGDQLLSSGTLDLNDEDVVLLKRGRLYVNALTAAFPHGELRGQIRPTDDNQNGVPDFLDAYVTQLCPCDGPWKSHAHYVRTVQRAVLELAAARLITGPEFRRVQRAAAHSDCGKDEL